MVELILFVERKYLRSTISTLLSILLKKKEVKNISGINDESDIQETFKKLQKQYSRRINLDLKRIKSFTKLNNPKIKLITSLILLAVMEKIVFLLL